MIMNGVKIVEDRCQGLLSAVHEKDVHGELQQYSQAEYYSWN